MRIALLLLVTLVVALLLSSVGVSGRTVAMVAGLSLLASPVAMAGALWVSGAKRGDFQTRTLAPWSLLFVLLVFLTATLVYALHAPDPWWLGPANGWGVALVVFALSSSLWLAPLKPIFQLRSALSDPAQIDERARALVASFESIPRPKSGVAARRHANRALAAVNVLSDALRFEDAERVLETVPLGALDDLRRGAIQASRAMVLLYRHDRNGSWAALKDGFRLAKDPLLLRALELLDALSSALDGHGKEALERLSSNVPTEKKLLRAWLIARSHALCAVGDAAEARACMKQLTALAPDGLRRVELLDGPASELARELQSLH